jgi:hypothetical protein
VTKTKVKPLTHYVADELIALYDSDETKRDAIHMELVRRARLKATTIAARKAGGHGRGVLDPALFKKNAA